MEVPTVLTLGYVLCALALAPLGSLSLDDNIKFQIFAFVVQLFLMAEFSLHFWDSAQHVEAPLRVVGDSYADVMGVAIFNFALCMCVPSWMNEKKPAVSVNKTIWGSMAAATFSYALIGVLGARSSVHTNDNMLTALGQPHMPALTRLCAFLFGAIIIGFGVPVSCLVIRYNLQLSNTLSSTGATLVATVAPWVLSWPLYQGHAALNVISYAGMVVNGLVNMLLPLALALSVADPSAFGLRKSMQLEAPSTVRPLPSSLERFRSMLIRAALALTLPAIVAATAIKTVSQISGS
uniref:Amino acid transporter transmembrane domain-containing protein n=2 Tax=Chrysotila carterae TaxID=13221 RepID=A0A7S4BD20_CHRCT